MTLAPQPQEPWHARPLSEVFAALQASERGLTESEARARLERFGPNRLPEQEAPPLWKIALRQFYSPLIYILLFAAIVSVFLGDLKDAGFIAAVLAINAVIGAYQEWKAEQSSLALRKLLQIRAVVLRDGEARDIAADEVVPGDIVWLESGNRVPADLRLLQVHGLEIDESLLTGESVAVEKDPAWTGPPRAPVGDRGNMTYAGSIVTRGRAKGFVVATGLATSVGQLALDVAGATGGKPPLLVRMERFSNVVAVGTLVSSAVIGLLAVLLGRYELSEMFLFVVALAVSAIPEGLPVAMTVALAVATTRMARRGVIVRRLTAVEGLGSCTEIATDKTGTLTVNEMTVREVRLTDGTRLQVGGEGFIPEGDITRNGKPVELADLPLLEALARAGVLCNEADLHRRDLAWQWRGDSVDVSLLTLGWKVGVKRETLLDQFPQINEIPFESEHAYAATFHRVASGVLACVKGSPERILAMCTVDPEDASRIEAEALDLAAAGYRILALADGDGPPDLHPDHAPPEPAGLRFLGLVGMIDPLRPGVREAVEACGRAGIQVTMITGDHRVTALAIARDLGFAGGESEVITGDQLEGRSEDELREIASRVRVFARVAPRQKLDIVRAVQAAGHYVAVTGDGVNDAPALRQANIGIAMGRGGTDVAREAAELVLSDDNFATIVAGVDEGRIAYDNIRKVTFLLLSTGAAELLMVLLTVIAGFGIILVPVQLLWLNLVTNGIQGVALAFEPGEGDTLQRKPRPPRESVFNRLMNERILLSVALMGGIAFATYGWLLREGWSEPEARNVVLLLMVLFENFHVFNSRSETKSAFSLSPLRSPLLLVGVLSALGLHLVAMHLPFLQDILGTAPLSSDRWMTVILLAATIVPIMELHKLTWWLRRRRRA